jgi:hypothetical protein
MWVITSPSSLLRRRDWSGIQSAVEQLEYSQQIKSTLHANQHFHFRGPMMYIICRAATLHDHQLSIDPTFEGPMYPSGCLLYSLSFANRLQACSADKEPYTRLRVQHSVRASGHSFAVHSKAAATTWKEKSSNDIDAIS